MIACPSKSIEADARSSLHGPTTRVLPCTTPLLFIAPASHWSVDGITTWDASLASSFAVQWFLPNLWEMSIILDREQLHAVEHSSCPTSGEHPKLSANSLK